MFSSQLLHNSVHTKSVTKVASLHLQTCHEWHSVVHLHLISLQSQKFDSDSWFDARGRQDRCDREDFNGRSLPTVSSSRTHLSGKKKSSLSRNVRRKYSEDNMEQMHACGVLATNSSSSRHFEPARFGGCSHSPNSKHALFLSDLCRAYFT
jgi:hypothetical protein